MILVETSAWVEFDRATGSRTHQRLRELIIDGADIAVTEPVLMEVLAGARSEAAAERLRCLLTSFHWLPADAGTDFEGAAKIYRACRRAGVTPGGLVDCLIAVVALRHGARLLTADAGFVRMARVVPLVLDV
ncbi:MAG TPA: PIN domain nuclease [Acidimicrobiia bacterium]|nr:PIN domain nuclease [Acidimicrobiia bacterium]